MIIRQRGPSSLWLLLLLISAASSQLDAECHLSIGDDKYDFSALRGDHTISRSRSLPPTNMTDTLRFNVCSELSLLEGVGSGDQVRIRSILKAPIQIICAVWQRDVGVSQQDKHQTRRVGQSRCSYPYCAGARVTGGIHQAIMCVCRHHGFRGMLIDLPFAPAPRGVKMTLHGPAYPSSTTLEPTPQEFVVDLLCATEESQPEFKSYDGTRALVEWSAPAGCNFRSDPSSGEDGKTPDKEAVGSGIGWFFLLFVFPSAFKDDRSLTCNTLRLFIAFTGYLALGAYYNYTTYGATGVDLIPCVSSLLSVALILKRYHLAVDIEISGARCHTCYETSSLISVVLSNHDTRVGADIWRYNPWSHTIFLRIILSGLCERA
jgi:autophagy-related protein 27